MALRSRQAKAAGSRMSRLYLLGGLLIATLMIGVLFAIYKTPTPVPVGNPDGVAAISEQIAQQCSMGKLTDQETTVTADLAKYISGVSSGTKVKTSDIGAIVSKITPDQRGLDFYKAYTDCLKQQAAILVNQRGANLVAPDQAEIESRKDESLRSAISEISAGVPRNRLVELLGQPIQTGPIGEGKEQDADFYQYKHMLFVADFRDKNDKRMGLFIMTKDPLMGQAMFPNQIFGKTIKDALEQCGGFSVTAHRNFKSSLCPASHATNYIMSEYFSLATVDASLFDTNCGDLGDDVIKSIEACPSVGDTPVLGVGIASENQIDAVTFERACNGFLDLLDFGGGFSWFSDRESDLEDQRNKRDENLSSDALAAGVRRDVRHRADVMRSPITPPI